MFKCFSYDYGFLYAKILNPAKVDQEQSSFVRLTNLSFRSQRVIWWSVISTGCSSGLTNLWLSTCTFINNDGSRSFGFTLKICSCCGQGNKIDNKNNAFFFCILLKEMTVKPIFTLVVLAAGQHRKQQQHKHGQRKTCSILCRMWQKYIQRKCFLSITEWTKGLVRKKKSIMPSAEEFRSTSENRSH